MNETIIVIRLRGTIAVDLAELILSYLEALAWPAVALMAVLLFRKPLSAVLLRLKSAQLPGSVKLDFNEAIREARKLSRNVSQAPLPEKARGRPSIPLTEANARMLELGLRPSSSGLDMSYYHELADEDANLALAGLRMEVEIMARNLAQGFQLTVSDGDTAGPLLRRLFDENAITVEQFQLAQKIVQICNAAVHGRLVTREEANAVIDVAQALTDQYVAWLSWGFNDGWSSSDSRDA